MFLRCANCIYATRIMSKAGNSTSVQIADLLLSAVFVDFALDRLTTDLIIFRISEETVLTSTRCDMIISFTFSITAAKYQITSCTTLRLNN